MKPDASVDCYGLLGVQPNAKDDEIKKAFRKQALLHHPDRNPGREEEAKSKFQDMQAAYDTLSNPAKRTRYDQERMKQDMLWQRRPGPSSQPAQSQNASYRQSQPPPRQTAKPAGSSRYADYTQPSRDSSPFGSDVNSRFHAWKAFEQMRGGHKPPSPSKGSPPKPRPAPTAQKSRSRSDWDETTYPESPRMPRTQSTRTPRRQAGFNPYAEEGDDTSSRNTSAYYKVSRGAQSQASNPRSAENVFAQANDRASASTQPPSNTGNASSEDYYMNDRLSTPYASHSGEKTYCSSANINRSASTASNLHKLNTDRARGSPGVGTGRFRSASPRARSPRPQPEDDTSPSSSEDEMRTDNMKQSQQGYYTRRGSADPRAHAPKTTVHDEAEEPPVFAMPKRQQTWDSEKFASYNSSRTHYAPSSPDDRPRSNTSEDTTPKQTRPHLERESTVPYPATGHNAFGPSQQGSPAAANQFTAPGKKPSLYEHYPFSFAEKSAGFVRKGFVASQVPEPSRTTPRAWPYWAIPSSVLAKSAGNGVGQGRHDFLAGDKATLDLKHADRFDQCSSFSIPSNSSGSASPLKSASAENVNTRFSPTNWHGQFFGSSSNLGPPPAPSTRTARSKGSSPKRPAARPTYISPPTTFHGTAGNETATDPPNKTSPAQPIHQPSPAKFSSEEWNKSFRGSTFSRPPLPTRPIATPRSRTAKRNPAGDQPSGSDATNPVLVSDDTGDEGDDEGRQSESNHDTDADLSRTASVSAMDIDNTPPATKIPSSTSTGPTSPTSNAMSPQPGLTSFPKPPPPSTAFNMQPLNATFPMSGSSSAGLSDLKADLGTTLPFESEAAPSTSAQPKAQKLDLPHPPKQPLPPGRLTHSSCAMYMNQVATYMREFHMFNLRMLEHLRARQAAMEQLTQHDTVQAEKGFVPMLNGVAGGGFAGSNLADTANWSWMGARGDDGYMKYMAWMEEDERVRVHHNLGWERHREALEKLGEVRKQMKSLVDRGLLA